MINQKTKYSNYSRSLLFELHYYDDKRTQNLVLDRNLKYTKVKFNKIGVEDSLSETKLDMNKLIINFCIISIHSSTINWKTEFVKDVR